MLFSEEDVTALPIEKRNVGMVFQSYALFPNMDVAENIAYGLTRAPYARRTDEAPSRPGDAGDDADRRPGGTAMSTSSPAASASAWRWRAPSRCGPRVLLLDEPLTALDALLRESLRVEIDGLLRSLGITAIYVTHDQAEAMALGDRIVVMSKGLVAQVGSPRDIYFSPGSPFVADFIGTVNRLSGEARDGVLETLAGNLPWKGQGRGSTEILFRPESVELVPVSEGHLRGRIVNALFLGDRTRVVLDVVNGTLVTADTRARHVHVLGEEVGLTVKADEIFTLPATDGPARI